MLKSTCAVYAIGMIGTALAFPAQAKADEAPPFQVEAGAIAAGEDSATTTVDASANVPLVIDVIPVGGEWDTFITVTNRATGELLGENDDGGNGLASRLVIPASFSGMVDVQVRNVSGASDSAQNRYVLLVGEAVVPEIETRPISVGDELPGALPSGGEAMYEFSAEEGQSFDFAVTAADGAWDTFAEIYPRSSVGMGEPVAVNDDRGGGSLDSFVTFIAPAAGEYVLRVSEVGDTGGNYTVTMARGPNLSGPEAFRPIGLDETRRMVISSSDTDRPMIELTDAAKSAMARGGTAVITLNGTRSDIDPVVAVGFETPLGFAQVAANDDHAGTLNSRLVLDVAALGNEVWRDAMRVQVNTINDGISEIELRVELQ